MLILAIETSCDETAAAVIEDGHKILSSEVASSIDLHKAFGGVVPEIAARSHIEVINPVIDEAMKIAKTKWKDIDAIAVTRGPGLGGSLLIGVLTARTLAITKNKPLYAINHVMAHPFACFITEASRQFKNHIPNIKLPESQPEFPMLALIVSGGHTQLVLFRSISDHTLLGQTRDDAVGEAFDKVAKILGLPYPGGPSISIASKDGDPLAYDLPIARLSNPYDFSFSGLKTAVLRSLQAQVGESHNFPSYMLKSLLNTSSVANMAASFQNTAVQTLVRATKRAVQEYNPNSVVVAGGVAANQELRRQFADLTEFDVLYPDISLCTDNAAMIGALAYQLQANGLEPSDPYNLDISVGLSM